jgi:hypothetical protein
MGEKQNQPFQLTFNASLKIDFQGSRVTSDGGLILVRELDERWGRRLPLVGENLAKRGGGDGRVSEQVIGNAAVPGFRSPGGGRNGASRAARVARNGTRERRSKSGPLGVLSMVAIE